ncbi:MAG: methanogenesis marker 8 protein [Methanomassiliicoccales archaeon]|jgi:putative methanogenesis marker protein 8
MSEHLLEMAKALVLVKDGKITVLSDPKIMRCPLRSNLYGCDEENRQTVETTLKKHMAEYGMYGPNRVLEANEKPVSFGASEIIMDAMTEGMVDAAVVVCDGAGTVIITRPEVLQATGAHMTGLIRTDPIPETQEGLRQRGCFLLDDVCTIDQVKGYLKATKSGFKRVAVTISGLRAFEARTLKEMGHVSGCPPVILAVHNSGVTKEDAEMLGESCDIVWACASKEVRDVVGKRAKIQIGISIPVFALSDMGKKLVLNRASHFDDGIVIHRASLPMTPSGKQPEPLI